MHVLSMVCGLCVSDRDLGSVVTSHPDTLSQTHDLSSNILQEADQRPYLRLIPLWPRTCAKLKDWGAVGKK